MHDNPQQATLYAYLAGILDGEGTISIAKLKPQLKCFDGMKYKNYKYVAYISVGMSCKEIVYMMSKEFNSESVLIECVPNRKDMYRFRASGRYSIRENLPKFMPYLVEKKERAKLVMEFVTEYETPYKRKNGLSPEELQRREDLFQKVWKLNHPGAAATTE